MSRTIWGNTTQNGIFVTDMTDNNEDYVYRIESDSKYFVRTCGWYENKDMEGEWHNAFAVFSDDAPFKAIWAVKTDCHVFDDNTEVFDSELRRTIAEFQECYLNNKSIEKTTKKIMRATQVYIAGGQYVYAGQLDDGRYFISNTLDKEQLNNTEAIEYVSLTNKNLYVDEDDIDWDVCRENCIEKLTGEKAKDLIKAVISLF